MKANELMIGDWVFHVRNRIVSGFEAGGPVRVLEIYEHGAQTDDGFVRHEDLEPIPLTPEILEKNGFVFSEGMTSDKNKYPTYCWGNNTTSVTLTFYKEPVCGVNLLTRIDTKCKHEGGANIAHNCDIESVHELQHALRLCGIEKEIKL